VDAQQNDISLEMTPFERGGSVHGADSSLSAELAQVYRIGLLFATQPDKMQHNEMQVCAVS
jgi:hypothetical protein